MAVSLSISLSQGTPNLTSRTTTVTASVTIHYSGGSYNGYSPSGTLTINGQSFGFTCNFNYAGVGQGALTQGSGSVTACSRTVTVSYGTSSTKTIYASASFNSGTASGTVTASDSITLTTISSGGGSGDSGGGESGGEGSSGSGSAEVTYGSATVVGGAYFYSETSTLNYSLSTTVSVSNYWYIPSVYVLKFKTPKFTGVSKSVSIRLGSINANFDKDDHVVCFALCKSDENHNMYLCADNTVDDSTQITSGTLSKDQWMSSQIAIQTADIKSETEYYVFFWMPPDDGYSSTADGGTTEYISVSVINMKPGTFNIDNGSALSEYECYIDNGSSWDRYECHIATGTIWELLSL